MSWYRNPRKRNAKVLDKFLILSKKILAGKIKNPLNIKAVGWGNSHLDKRNSFNFNQSRKIETASYKPHGAYHLYVAY